MKPKIIVSACLFGKECRWDGGTIPNNFLSVLNTCADFVLTCPEQEIGLSTPRTPLRIVRIEEKHRLQEYETGADYTQKMEVFSNNFLENLDEEIDGFILKNRSPSCGIGDVKLYKEAKKSMPIGKTSGVFGEKVKTRFAQKTAIEDEGRLRNFELRTNFLTHLFTLRRFKNITSSDIADYTDFHARHKYLFMAYSPALLKKMGNILANHHQLSFEKVLAAYREHLHLLFTEHIPTHQKHINVLQHCVGYFSDQLLASQKKFFQELLKKYREKHIPLMVLTSLLKNFAHEFEDKYLLSQYYLDPFPEELIFVD